MTSHGGNPARAARGRAAIFGPVAALLAAAAEIAAHALALPRLPWAIGAGIAAAGFRAWPGRYPALRGH